MKPTLIILHKIPAQLSILPSLTALTLQSSLSCSIYFLRHSTYLLTSYVTCGYYLPTRTEIFFPCFVHCAIPGSSKINAGWYIGVAQEIFVEWIISWSYFPLPFKNELKLLRLNFLNFSLSPSRVTNPYPSQNSLTPSLSNSFLRKQTVVTTAIRQEKEKSSKLENK